MKVCCLGAGTAQAPTRSKSILLPSDLNASQMNEAYGAAARHAASYARVLVGKAAGASLALGVSGAMGSTILYATALPHYADEMKLKGFNEATDNLYVSAAPALALAKTAPAKAAPAPALAPSPPSAQPRATLPQRQQLFAA